jgi:hypothetical protein
MISNLIEEIGLSNKKANETYKLYKEQKQAVDELKQQLIAELDKAGLKSAKGKKFQASIAQKLDIEVTHERSVIDWLKSDPNVEEDAYIGLKLTPFKTLAKEVLKKSGEIIPGTETVHKESLIIRGNK